MANPKLKNKVERSSKNLAQSRRFESESMALQSLRLIAAPKPEDDLSDEELAAIVKGSSYSSELIQNLIECIKSI